MVNPETQIKELYPLVPPKINSVVGYSGALYAKGEILSGEVSLYRVSKDSNKLIKIREVPILYSRGLTNQLYGMSNNPSVDQLKESAVGADQFFKQLAQRGQGDALSQHKLYEVQHELTEGGLHGAFAVSGDTFYLEYDYKLFRWEPGDTKWYDTGVEETSELTRRGAAEAFELAGMPREKIGEILMTWSKGFKIAVSEDTVYVGKRDGHLVVSSDRGNDWIDATPALPFPVKAFKDIVFVGSTVYVATDEGVVTSSDGKQWQAVTDSEGTALNIDKLTVDGIALYGVTKRTAAYYGVTNFYRLESGTWQQIAPEVSDRITSLVVDGDTLYVGTEDRGMRYINLEK